MAIERMLTEELPARVLVARGLAEAGIEYVFGITGGHTGRIVSGLSQVQNQVRMVTVREESLAGVMAEVYGRLTRRPGVMLGQGPWVLGNGLIGTLEAFLSSSPMLLLTDFSDAPRFSLHAPYQQATGDYGSWDARRAGADRRGGRTHSRSRAPGDHRRQWRADFPRLRPAARPGRNGRVAGGDDGGRQGMFSRDPCAGARGLRHLRHPGRQCMPRR